MTKRLLVASALFAVIVVALYLLFGSPFQRQPVLPVKPPLNPCLDEPGDVFCDPLTEPDLTAEQDAAIAPPPPADFQLRATPQKNGILISWQDVGLDILGYYAVYRCSRIPFPFLCRKIAEVRGDSYLDTKVSKGRTYHYRIKTVDVRGRRSTKTSPTSITY